MILLLGGTSDTLPIALRLAERGHRVLVSKATDVPLAVGDHPQIETRHGRLDDRNLADLLDERAIRAIVDATHPYAVAIRAMARRAAEAHGIPYLTFVRPPAVDPAALGVEFAPDHRSAARRAFGRGRPVLLTTGTRNLDPYVEESRRTSVPLIVRALDHPQSLDVCRRAGIPPERMLAGRGPFSVEENRRHLHEFDIGVLVTKDSGFAGGVLEKLEAARAENCHVIVVARPVVASERAFTEIERPRGRAGASRNSKQIPMSKGPKSKTQDPLF